MQKFKFVTAFLFLTILKLEAIDSSYKFEGVFGVPIENIQNQNKNALFFIPYNPVIVETDGKNEVIVDIGGGSPLGCPVISLSATILD